MATSGSDSCVCSLIGDIGGTNARLQLVSYRKENEYPIELKTIFYKTRDYTSLEACIHDFLAEFKNTEQYPHNATLAVAGAPYERKVTLPNLNWPTLDEESLEKEFNITPFALINDFVAIGYSMIKIPDEDLLEVIKAKKQPNATRIVAGPGTGLGECVIMVNKGHGNSDVHNVFGTEGGHKNFAPTSKMEWEYASYVLEEVEEIKEKFGYLSTEKSFCGPGIPNIYHFFCWKESIKGEDLTSEEIVQKGLAKSDERCVHALELFITLYAKEVSNFALNSLPYGGIYLVGGLTNEVADYIKNDPKNLFKKGFFSKGNVINAVLERFPIYIVKTRELGLKGTFVKAQMDAFKI